MNKNDFINLQIGDDVCSIVTGAIFEIVEISKSTGKIKIKTWKTSEVCEYSKNDLLKHFDVSEITTAKNCWNVYAKAVGGKTFNGKPLPKFKDLKQQKIGWIAVAKLMKT
jgi:hypothetical protein